MKTNLLSNNGTLNIRIDGEIGLSEEKYFDHLLDHAWFDKRDVSYDESEKKLVIKLRRHEEGSKARKKFLGLGFWDNSIAPTKNSQLIIKNIERCDIRDADPQNTQRQEVITGGISVKPEEIYFGAFCEHENPYGISIKVAKVDITLEDI